MAAETISIRAPGRRSGWARLTTPAGAAAVTAAVVLMIVVLHLAANGWRFGAFPVFGDRFVDASSAPSGVVVHDGSAGYDGQFVYRLGLDPFTSETTARGITLDNPAYRSSRIALPMLAWLLARLGVPILVGLVLLNGVALVGVGYFAARLAERAGAPALLGVLVALAPGLVISLTRDLTEPLAICGLVAGLWWWRQHRMVLAGIAFCVGALARETILVVLAGMGVYHLWRFATARGTRRPELVAILTLLAPLVTEICWQGWIRHAWGTTGLAAHGNNLSGTPFVGVFTNLFDGAGSSGSDDGHSALLAHLWAVERIALLGFLALIAVALVRRHSRPPLDVRLGWLAAVGLAFSVSRWTSDVAFLRATLESFVVGLLVLAHCRSCRYPRMVWAGSAVWSLALVVVYGAFL